MSIQKKSYPRAALIGNPSDGYYGKTIAFVFSNFSAEVELQPSENLQIIPSERDYSDFENVRSLVRDIRLHGYYGGIRLLKAAIKKFYEYCENNGIDLADKNFTLRYQSNIPHRLGLAGSSAIITACVRTLMEYYEVEIEKALLANLVLAVETEELHIQAGLQDRVAQAYEQPVYMDFDQTTMKEKGFGHYVSFSPSLLPNLYIAYKTELSEGSEVMHNDLKERYFYGEQAVLDAISEWTSLTEKAMKLLKEGKKAELAPLLNKNFDIRRSICAISVPNIKMVEVARSVGASAKFTGSGGAIIGTYENDKMFARLKDELVKLNVRVIKPEIVNK